MPPPLFRRAATNRDDLAISEDGGATITWGDLEAHVSSVASALLARSERPLKVGLLSANRLEYWEVLWAAIRAGATIVPVNWRLAVTEVAYILQDAEIDLLFVDEAYETLARAAAPDLPLVVFGRDFEALRSTGAGDLPAGPAGRLMLYSSGTSGRPKGVLHPAAPSAEAFVAALAGQARSFDFPPDGLHLVTGPLYHAAPLSFAASALAAGESLHLMRHFDELGFLRLISERAVATSHVVPIMMVRLMRLSALERARFDVSSLRSVVHGAAPCPPSVKQAFIEWVGAIVHEYYGATDAPASLHVTSQEWLARPGTVGRPGPGVALSILDDDGAPVAPGEIGTVYLGGSSPPPEYHGDPQKTAASRRPDGLVTVGDMGYVDADGYLFLVDRKIDLIVSGGVNIYPAEVEACLSEHPGVSDCCVFGIPDDEWGEQVKALVVRGDPGLTQEALIAWCQARIARFKAPRTVEFRSDLPRNAAGKLMKKDLRGPYWAGRDRQI